MWTQVGEQRVGRTGRLELKYIYHLCKQLLVGTCYKVQGAQLGALWRPGGWDAGVQERGLRGRGYMYTFNLFTSLCSGNWHNIIKQLYLNIKRNSNNRNNIELLVPMLHMLRCCLMRPALLWTCFLTQWRRAVPINTPKVLPCGKHGMYFKNIACNWVGHPCARFF